MHVAIFKNKSCFSNGILEDNMRISYEKLWHLMRKNKMKKRELAAAAELSSYSMAKLNKSEPVSLEIMLRFCKIFHCDIGDIMEVIEND